MKHLLVLALLAASISAPAFANDHATTGELMDGTKVEINGDTVEIVKADGSKVAAPDGTHTLKDGTTITTKDGKKAE